jgi:hypothetical protein
MHLNPNVAELVVAFRESESDDQRGPMFKAVALALETEMKTTAVTKETVLECFDPPDKFEDHSIYVYRFDHELPGRNNDEWYFHFADGRLSSSGYNVRGINDLSHLKDRADFPTRA